MKRLLSAMLCVLAILVICPSTARADMGPKPSVVIDFAGLDGETYYATLLSSVESTGPYSALVDGDLKHAQYQPGDEGYAAFLEFQKYSDPDGYYFLQYFQDCSKTHRFDWTYYPPQNFKILLYFPESDRIIVSGDSYERYAFDSYFAAKVTLSDPNAGIALSKSYDYTTEVLSLLVRILLTVAAELGIALMFGFGEKKLFRFIVIVNAVTQIALNATLNLINYHLGGLAFVFFYVLLEIAVFFAEAILYAWYLKNKSVIRKPCLKAWGYALIANAASFALGLGLAHWIPGIF